MPLVISIISSFDAVSLSHSPFYVYTSMCGHVSTLNTFVKWKQQKILETIAVSRIFTERRGSNIKNVKNTERKGFVELPAFQVTKK